METSTFVLNQFKSDDLTELTTYHWSCENPKAILHIVHGMSEHAARYDHFAKFMVNNGFEVFSSDLRGHGKTAGKLDNVGQFALNNGWDRVVKDLSLLTEHFKNNRKLPVYILGHSMGSFLARTLIKDYPSVGDCYIFSATAGHPGLLGIAGKKLAGANAFFLGKKNRSQLLTKMAFGDFNKKYENPRTEKDWLSKDTDVVDKYIADEYCMQTFTGQFFEDLLDGILRINSSAYLNGTPKNKPVYMFAGDMDPVGNYGKGPKEVLKRFKEVGIKDIELKMYPDGRHEMLNETNKEEVYNDLLTWMNKKL